MQFQNVAAILKDIPHMELSQGKIIYDFVRSSSFQNILELGFAHGTSTCYMAAALEENGSGLIKTIDKQSAKDRRPDIYALLEETKLNKYVRPIFADTSYNWELMKIIQDQTTQGICEPIFDFCFIDGAHSWEVDGLAFFLVEKLLKPGGWILFDDLNWTYSNSVTASNIEWVKALPEEQKTTPQVNKVFSLLVCQHPNFENFRIVDGWGWTQKKALQDETARNSNNLVNEIYLQQGIKGDVISLLRKVQSRLKV